jgi:hypothetical protein
MSTTPDHAGRVRTIATKVSEAEAEQIMKSALAARLSLSEYIRTRLLGSDSPTESRYTAVSRAVLGSVIASRILLMTAIYDMMRGNRWTNEDFARHALTAERQARQMAETEIGGES